MVALGRNHYLANVSNTDCAQQRPRIFVDDGDTAHALLAHESHDIKDLGCARRCNDRGVHMQGRKGQCVKRVHEVRLERRSSFCIGGEP
jgi:hypothetical protein